MLPWNYVNWIVPTSSRQNSGSFHYSSCWPVWIPLKSCLFFFFKKNSQFNDNYNRAWELFYDASHFHIIFNVLYLMREALKGSKLRHKRIHPCVFPTPTNLSSSRHITKSFWGIQRREVKSGEFLLELQPYGRETQQSNCRMSEWQETFRTRRSHHDVSFTEG